MLGEAPERVALVHAEPLGGPGRTGCAAALRRYDVLLLPVPDGEDAKTASGGRATAGSRSARPAFTRSDAVVTLGGGATTDLGGFVAATWLRGVRVVHLPDHACSRWSTPRSAARPASTPAPARTSSAPSTSRPACSATWRLLDTLPRAELVAGLAEVVKCGFIADPRDPRPRRGDRPG